MPNNIGCSLYPTTFQNNLPDWIGKGSLVFTSAQLPQTTHQNLKNLIDAVHAQNGQVVVDINDRTADQLGYKDEAEMQKDLDIDMFRLDDGYSLDQTLALCKERPIAVNASTHTKEEIEKLLAANSDNLFIHNFYPRPETGLDIETFEKINRYIPDDRLIAFINGDSELRGPVFEGLVTLEDQRSKPPYLNYVQLRHLGIKNILVGDPGLSQAQAKMIRLAAGGIFSIPCELADPEMYGKVYQTRFDSPVLLKRLLHTRAPLTEPVGPGPVEERFKGAITQDNLHYGRYQGEISITGKALPADERVNVIGMVHPDYLDLIEWIDNGSNIVLTNLETLENEYSALEN